MVVSHTPSPSASVIGLQLPHQLFHVPLTSGVVKASVTWFISTWKVTLTVEGWQGAGEVEVKKEPVVGFGPYEPKTAPAGSVIWKVISLS